MTLENLSIHDTATPDDPSVFSTLKKSAEEEFRASTQLLAERAMFLLGATSAAIAIRNSESVISYVAAAGACQRVPGAEITSADESADGCLKESKVVRKTLEAVPDKFKLFVPILSEAKAIGFFELVSRFEFQDLDVLAIERLADLVTIANDRQKAVADVRARLVERSSAMAALATVQAQANNLRETTPRDGAEAVTAPAVPSFSSCSSCGFPVSALRNLCVECEQKLEPAAAKPPELFAVAPQESWISAHGYTIASAIVTLLAAAIIVWLHRH